MCSTSTRASWPTRRCGTALAALVAPAETSSWTSKTEAELAELPEDEAAEMAAELGMGEPGLTRLARAGFAALGLQTFLTAGPKETRAWEIPVGATAPEAAGVIHTDFQRGFIKAEIVSYDDLVAAGLAGRRPGRGQGPDRGQGLRHAGRRRSRVPLQRLSIRTLEVAPVPGRPTGAAWPPLPGGRFALLA